MITGTIESMVLVTEGVFMDKVKAASSKEHLLNLVHIGWVIEENTRKELDGRT